MTERQNAIVSEQTENENKPAVSVIGKRCFVILRRDSEEGGYRVECPALAGCTCHGETVEKALAMMKQAIQVYVEARRNKLKAKVK